jgi:hypothetical protein
MRRQSTVSPKAETKSQKHIFSFLLEADPRKMALPRHVAPVPNTANKWAVRIKIYAPLDAPGSELLTVSCVSPRSGVEYEMRFDERYPVSIRFRKEDDEQKVVHAVRQIGMVGGIKALFEIFEKTFPGFA